MKWHWLLPGLAVMVAALVVALAMPPQVASDDRVVKEDELHVTRLHQSFQYHIYRFVDAEAQVACWGVSGDGISCLPLSETSLDY